MSIASDSPSTVAQRLAALQAANIQYLESDNIDLATTVRFECHLVATSIELLILDTDAQISVGHLREPAGALPKLLALAQRLDALGISTTLVQRGTVEALHPDLAKALDGIVTITASMNVSFPTATAVDTSPGLAEHFSISGRPCSSRCHNDYRQPLRGLRT